MVHQLLGAGEERCEPDTENRWQPREDDERRISGAAFDLAHPPAADAGFERQAVLREPPLSPRLTYRLPERAMKVNAVRHARNAVAQTTISLRTIGSIPRR
jgi:hypothetical protein